MATATKTKTNGKHKPATPESTEAIQTESLDLSTVMPVAPEKHSAKGAPLSFDDAVNARTESTRAVYKLAREESLLLHSIGAPVGSLERIAGDSVLPALRNVAAATKSANRSGVPGSKALAAYNRAQTLSKLRGAFKRNVKDTFGATSPEALSVAKLRPAKDDDWKGSVRLGAETVDLSDPLALSAYNILAKLGGKRAAVTADDVIGE